MPASSQVTTAGRPRQAPRDVRVRAWPLAEGDRVAWGAIFVAGLLFAAAAYVSRSAGTAAVITGLLVISLWRLWVPVQFELSAGGITRTVLGRARRVSWSQMGSIQRRERGVLVLRDFENGPLSLLRGVYIPYNNHQADVLAIFDFYLAGRAETH